MASSNARGGGGGARSLVGADDQKLRNIHTLDVRAQDPHYLEEKLLRDQFRRERSSAYWFAASTWGIAGLVLGACAGAYMMYVASVATLPVAQDAISRGMAMQEIQRQSDGRPGLLSPDREQTP